MLFFHIFRRQILSQRKETFRSWPAFLLNAIMQGLLRLALFSLLLPPASFLECETCSATSSNCTGGSESCEDDQDSCAISLTVVSKGGKIYPAVEKGCYSSYNCSAGWIWVTFGRQEFIRKSVSCCLGNDCSSAFSQLPPPRNTTANGKRCPACYAAPKACSTAVVNCTGSDNYCLDMMMYQFGEKVVNLKGCTTESTCAELQTGQRTFLGVGENIDCRPASQSSSLSGSFLLCLLLMTDFL
ncbi:phospholipase A2 inhibitor and Ly6/PLAUR domain-containing protein isoform X4 [Pogona vitticeps]